MKSRKKKKNTIKIASVYKGCDSAFLTVLIVLITYGIIMCFSASAPSAQSQMGDAYYFVKRQIFWVCIGLCAMTVTTFIDARIYQKYSKFLITVSILATALTLLMPATKGAKRWLGIGSMGIQPSEMIKITLIIFLADRLSKQKWSPRANSLTDFSVNYVKDFGKYILVLGIICLILLLQPHLSCTILICMVAGILFIVGGVKWSYLLATTSAGIAVLAGFAFSKGYTMERLESYLDPFKYAKDEGYQVVQSFYAIGSGGLFGLGLGQSRQKFLYIPEPQNDFIFSIICEELGFFGALSVIFLFAVLIYRGIVIALNCKDTYSAMVVVGIITLITVQVTLNIGVVTGLIPNTGVSLPFFSYGGSALVFMLASMGIVLNISKNQ